MSPDRVNTSPMPPTPYDPTKPRSKIDLSVCNVLLLWVFVLFARVGEGKEEECGDFWLKQNYISIFLK